MRDVEGIFYMIIVSVLLALFVGMCICMMNDMSETRSFRKEAAEYCYSKGEDVWVEYDERLQQYICVSSGIKRRVK